jgi:hypothetical protein
MAEDDLAALGQWQENLDSSGDDVQLALLQLQLRYLEEQQAAYERLTNLMKTRHATAVAAINNLKG